MPVGRGAGVDWLLGSPESPLKTSLFPEAERRLFAKQCLERGLRGSGIEVPVVERGRDP